MASKCVIYCGGRGSGKSLSMSYEGFRGLVLGENVWANYPIAFDFKFSDTVTKHYKSQPLEIEDLVSMKPEIRDGIILLDELNLWASNRGALSMINRLLNAWMQLLRKRKLDLYITVQAFESLDRMIRWQCDMTIACSDLKFRYRNLEEGAMIGQELTDRSGMFTGRQLYAYSDWQAYYRNTRSRIFKGKSFWGIYDSWSEYDIIKAMTKYEIQREVKVIGPDGLVEPYGAMGNISVDQARMLKLKTDILTNNPEGSRNTKTSVYNMMEDAGISGGRRYLDKLLESNGFVVDGNSFIVPME